MSSSRLKMNKKKINRSTTVYHKLDMPIKYGDLGYMGHLF